jgi:hypothetical protein
VRAEDLGHRRHDLSSLTYAVLDLVRGDLVRHLAEERGVGAGFAGRLGGFGSYETAWARLHPLSELIGGTGNDWDEPPDD